MSERVAIVGASLAGLHAAHELRTLGFDGELTIVGEEPHAPYDRPPLSKELLAGTRTEGDVALPVDEGLGADWRLGVRASGLDLERRVVRLGDGDALPFDGLVIATGVRPRTLPGLDAALPGVHALRTLDDARALRAALRPGAELLIVGAGFVGVEVATVARAAGCAVTIVSLDPPLALAGPPVSAACTELLRDAGVRLALGRRIVTIEGGAAPHGVVLDDGTRVGFDAALVAIGAVPNVEWLEGSGLTLADGVVCDASLAALGGVAVVAAGDVARWPNAAAGGALMRVEHWSNAVAQGTAAARTLLQGPGAHSAHGSVPDFWSDHLGTRLQSVGALREAVRWEVVAGSVAERRFAATGHDGDGRLVGAVAYGMPRAIQRWRLELSGEGACA